MAQAPFNFTQVPLEEVKPQALYQPGFAYSTGQAPITSSQFIGSVPVPATNQTSIKGESRIEYHPYEKSVIEYEAVPKTEYVAREKKVVDHYAVEYQTEYIPQVFQDRYIEYVPQERVVERIEYQAVQRQIVHQPQQEVVQQELPVQQIFQTAPAVQTVQVQQAPVAVAPQAQLATSTIPVYQNVVYQQQPLVASGVWPQWAPAQNFGVKSIVKTEAAPAPVAVAQKKIQQKTGGNEQGEPGFLEMLFGTTPAQNNN